MTTISPQITSLMVVYSIVYSDADQRKHQSSASLAFVWGIHRDRWIPRTKGQLRGKCFHLMTSSCTFAHAPITIKFAYDAWQLQSYILLLYTYLPLLLSTHSISNGVWIYAELASYQSQRMAMLTDNSSEISLIFNKTVCVRSTV